MILNWQYLQNLGKMRSICKGLFTNNIYHDRYLDSAYQNLAGMLKSSAHSADRLPIIPFSGRWFESRLLLDCINYKVLSNYL